MQGDLVVLRQEPPGPVVGVLAAGLLGGQFQAGYSGDGGHSDGCDDDGNGGDQVEVGEPPVLQLLTEVLDAHLGEGGAGGPGGAGGVGGAGGGGGRWGQASTCPHL